MVYPVYAKPHVMWLPELMVVFRTEQAARQGPGPPALQN